MAEVQISELAPETLCDIDAVISIPPWAFKPDTWNFAFLMGLQKVLGEQVSGARIWEVGCGTGFNLIALSKVLARYTVYYSDFNPECTLLTGQNLQRAGVGTPNHHPLWGSWDLVSPPAGQKAPTVDILMACIPQVPLHADLTSGDMLAHYYDPKNYPEATLHACGLGLNEALLVQAKSVLVKNGMVVLNLGGRPGIECLKGMFSKLGFTPYILHTEVVPQHARTSVATLAELESRGNADFEFFADAEAKWGINAREAEQRRTSGKPVFHKIYVLAGLLT